MVSRYPHTIVVTWKSKATQDANLNWVEGAQQNFSSECRAEVNSSGRKTAGVDGALIDYAMAIYMPLASQVIPIGANFTLNGSIVGTVKGAWNGQFNSKLWV